MAEPMHGNRNRYNQGCRCDACRAAHTEYTRKWRQGDPDVNVKRTSAYHALSPERKARFLRNVKVARLRRQYGLTPEQRSALFRESDGLCALCYEEPAVHIDHDHETGRVRGVLCRRCNVGLGMFGDTIEGLQRAIDYLRLAEVDLEEVG